MLIVVALSSCSHADVEYLFPSTPSKTVVSVTVSGPGVMYVGQPGSVGATAHFSDGSSVVVTEETSFSSNNSGVVAVRDPNGVSALAPGTAVITGTYRGVSGTTLIMVEAPVASSSAPFDLLLQETIDRLYGGTLNSDGVFSATLQSPITLPSGTTIATTSTFTGRVTETSEVIAPGAATTGRMTGTETLRFSAGCPGQVVYSYSGTSSSVPSKGNPTATFQGTATRTEDPGCNFVSAFPFTITMTLR